MMNASTSIGRCLVVLAVASLPMLATAKGAGQIDWLKMIECRATFDEYGRFALEDAQHAQFTARWKLKLIKQANPMLAEYELAAPITVYGHATRRVAFTSSGVMAVLPEKDALKLAKQLQLEVAYQAGDKILATRTVQQTEPEELAGIKLWRVMSHDVSTVSSHPGKTLVGCSYATMTE